MKKLLTLISLTFIPFLVISQVPKAFNYQATVRNSADEPVLNESHNFQIDIIDASGIVYSEQYLNQSTGSLGIVNFKVGMGTVIEGDFTQIDWASDQFQIKISMNGNEIGISDIVAVPFALYAESSGDKQWKEDGPVNIYYDEGKVGIGMVPETNLTVSGTSTLTHPLSSSIVKLKTATPDLDAWIRSHDENDETQWILNMMDRDRSNSFGIFSSQVSQYIFRLRHQGYAEINGSENNLLLGLRAATDLDAWISSYDETGNRQWVLNMLDRSDGNRFGIFSQALENYVFSINQQSGRSEMYALKISGQANGWDLDVTGNSRFLNPSSSNTIQLETNAADRGTWISSFDETDNRQWVINMMNRTTDNSFGIFSSVLSQYLLTIHHDGNVGIGVSVPDSKLHVAGKTKTTCLEITGGCDIKEDLNSIEALEPGDVVVIDTKNPGQITRTNQAYDKKVAGIISGANGVNPGLSLSQDDVFEGEYPLAMLGRVYVKVTGQVEIGDMLTTSTTPGYAMSVTDHTDALGTIIGKAMTSNDDEEGMVLVLVNLQ